MSVEKVGLGAVFRFGIWQEPDQRGSGGSAELEIGNHLVQLKLVQIAS